MNRNKSSATFTLLIYSILFLQFVFSLGCAPSSAPSDGSQNSSIASSDLPELDEETIRERINGTRVRKVLEENNQAEPITWGFDEDEPKEIQVVEKQIEGIRATIILDIKTESSTRSRERRSLAGQIKTIWKLESGWALRRWEIVEIENISMKYKNLPKTPAQNSNN